jgi:phosphohistidine phosphatase
MKTLLIMRHGKSSWKQKNLPDLDRSLHRRGEKDSRKTGRYLKKKDLVPDLILSSPAVRAKQTADIVAEESHYKKEIQFVDRLYMAEAVQIIETLNQLPNNLETVLLIGHNPGLEYTVQLLSRTIVTLPTAALVTLKVPIDRWADIKEDTECELVKTWFAKD